MIPSLVLCRPFDLVGLRLPDGKRHLFIGVGLEDGAFVAIARRLSRAAAGSTELHEQRGPAHGTGLLDGPDGQRLGGQLLRFVLD